MVHPPPVVLRRSYDIPRIRTMLRAFAYEVIDGEPILAKTGITAAELAGLSETLLRIVDAAEEKGLLQQAGERR